MPWRRFASRDVGFDSQSVVHGSPELLLASEVALGRLNRDVPEQELNLVQFATREMAQTGTSASEVVGCQLVDAGPSGGGAHSGRNEPGERLIVTGRTLDGSKVQDAGPPFEAASVILRLVGVSPPLLKRPFTGA